MEGQKLLTVGTSALRTKPCSFYWGDIPLSSFCSPLSLPGLTHVAPYRDVLWIIMGWGYFKREVGRVDGSGESGMNIMGYIV